MMGQDLSLQTARLSLTPLAAADRDELVAALDDYEVSRWLTLVPYPYRGEDFDDFLTHVMGSPDDIVLVIRHQGAFCGVVGLEGQLGYWLARDHHGQGVMTEAAGALVDYAMRKQNQEEIDSGYFEGNEASVNVLRKLGFTETGEVTVQTCRARGEKVNCIQMKLTRESWKERQ